MAQLHTRYIFATGAWCALIFYLSSVQDPPDPGLSIPYLDKVAHALLYAGLTATLAYGIRESNEAPGVFVQWCVPVLFALVYGVTDELHQVFVPMRTWELSDLIADGSGAILAQVLYAAWLWQRPKPQ